VVNQEAICPEYPASSVTRLYRNDSKTGNWISVALQGTDAESNGIGSRVKLVVGKTAMIREIDGGGSSHVSQNSIHAHFGVGSSELIDSLIVQWTGGNTQVLTNVKANQFLVIREIPKPVKKMNWMYWLIGFGVV
ncbi:ASPIC/UnbV domain-containing protein, partial [Flavihumibacter sediminis]|nr:ASPIC/UnbV domain-containing protein [Flavihumibacter sediminis]